MARMYEAFIKALRLSGHDPIRADGKTGQHKTNCVICAWIKEHSND